MINSVPRNYGGTAISASDPLAPQSKTEIIDFPAKQENLPSNNPLPTSSPGDGEAVPTYARRPMDSNAATQSAAPASAKANNPTPAFRAFPILKGKTETDPETISQHKQVDNVNVNVTARITEVPSAEDYPLKSVYPTEPPITKIQPYIVEPEIEPVRFDITGEDDNAIEPAKLPIVNKLTSLFNFKGGAFEIDDLLLAGLLIILLSCDDVDWKLIIIIGALLFTDLF
jgi:hypothetical protein